MATFSPVGKCTPWHTLLNVPWPNLAPILKSPINVELRELLFWKDDVVLPFDLEDL